MASVRLADSTLVRASFVTPDVVRTYLNVPGGVKIVELDARSRVLQDTGFIASPNFLMVYADSSAAHMLVRQPHEDRLTLNDARTGAAIRTLTNGTQVKAARYLRDGRIAIVDGPDSAAVLHILAADGTLQRDIPLGAKRATRIVGDDGTRVVLNQGASDGGMLEANIASRFATRSLPAYSISGRRSSRCARCSTLAREIESSPGIQRRVRRRASPAGKASRFRRPCCTALPGAGRMPQPQGAGA
jgi:hypothetical protein